MAGQSLACSVVGSPAQVEQGLHEFIEITKPDELMVVGLIYDQAARLRSYEIAGEVRERLGAEEWKGERTSRGHSVALTHGKPRNYTQK